MSNKFFIVNDKRYETVVLSNHFQDGVGIGVEITEEFSGEIIQIFYIKDSGRKVISILERDVDMDLVEKAIAIFKEEIF